MTFFPNKSSAPAQASQCFRESNSRHASLPSQTLSWEHEWNWVLPPHVRSTYFRRLSNGLSEGMPDALVGAHGALESACSACTSERTHRVGTWPMPADDGAAAEEAAPRRVSRSLGHGFPALPPTTPTGSERCPPPGRFRRAPLPPRGRHRPSLKSQLSAFLYCVRHARQKPSGGRLPEHVLGGRPSTGFTHALLATRAAKSVAVAFTLATMTGFIKKRL